MNTSRSDAFVFFGATGDLAYKKIFPALQALIKRQPVLSILQERISSESGDATWTIKTVRCTEWATLNMYALWSCSSP